MSESTETVDQLRQEIRQLKQQLEELTNAKHMMDAIMELAPALISAKDLNGNVILTNQQFNVLDGPDPDEYIGRNIYDLFPHEIANELWENDCEVLLTKRPIESEEQVYHKDHTLHTYYTVKFPLHKENGEAFAIGAFSLDITSLKQAQEDSVRDALTGLYNRRHFQERMQKEYTRACRNEQDFVFLIIDIDHFKEFNDTYGHEMGDQSLLSVAKVIQENFNRISDFLFRLGGEEFGCMYNSQDEQSGYRIAEQLRENVENLAIEHRGGGASNHLTVSIGGTLIKPDQRLDYQDIFGQADNALYQAKSKGRNRVCFFNSPLLGKL